MTDRKKYPPEVQKTLERLRKPNKKPYAYFDREGRFVGGTIRIEEADGKGFSQFRISSETGELEFKAIPEPKPLYNLPALMAAPPDKPVLIVEGEKTAEAAMLIPELSEFVVVTWPGGAHNFDKADWSLLDGRKKVVIWPDNDEHGMKAAHGIVKILLERNAT